jgi:hypothetical protein
MFFRLGDGGHALELLQREIRGKPFSFSREHMLYMRQGTRLLSADKACLFTKLSQGSL